MTNVLYPSGKQKLLEGSHHWLTDDFRCALVRGYTYTSGNTTVADVVTAGGTIVASSSALTGKTSTSGVAAAADVTFTAVAAGADITSIVLYKEGATNATRELLAFIDTATGLPCTPNGTDITIVWDATNKIFKL